MKLKKLLTLSIAIFALTFYGYGQVEEAEAPMFGGTRSLNEQIHNFNEVSGKIQSYQFKIKNLGKTTMHIIDIKIPEKVGITLINKSIKKASEGIILVTIDPTVMEKVKFSKNIVVITEQKEPGIITGKEITFTITGVVK